MNYNRTYEVFFDKLIIIESVSEYCGTLYEIIYLSIYRIKIPHVPILSSKKKLMKQFYHKGFIVAKHFQIPLKSHFKISHLCKVWSLNLKCLRSKSQTIHI